MNPTTTPIALQDIRLLELDDIKLYLESIGEKGFRAKQIYEWLWKHGVHSFEAMTNLSAELRSKLQANFVINAIKTNVTQRSSDGTIKIRFQLHDGHMIESVLIPVSYENRYTVCVSCQVGCSLTCSFCATGRIRRVRNLDPAEIYDQVLLVNEICKTEYDHVLTNIVYMGMGEPLLAFNPVLKSIDLITSPQGMGMAAWRITVSTAGISKMIMKLADMNVRFNLALSLHAADDEKRNEIMPINEQNDLKSLTEALLYFRDTTTKDNKITFEYVALQNFNDSTEDAHNLARLARTIPEVHVNIIEYNPIENGEFSPSHDSRLQAFLEVLKRQQVSVSVRRSRGKDIDAACGQLANKD